MPTKLESPTKVESIGTKPKIIHEYIGLVNSKTNDLSIAQMESLVVGQNLDSVRISMNTPLFWMAD